MIQKSKYLTGVLHGRPLVITPASSMNPSTLFTDDDRRNGDCNSLSGVKVMLECSDLAPLLPFC